MATPKSMCRQKENNDHFSGGFFIAVVFFVLLHCKEEKNYFKNPVGTRRRGLRQRKINEFQPKELEKILCTWNFVGFPFFLVSLCFYFRVSSVLVFLSLLFFFFFCNITFSYFMSLQRVVKTTILCSIFLGD